MKQNKEENKITAGLLILISIFSLGSVVFTLTKTKRLKYIFTLLISPLYVFLLFFIGMSVSGAVFYFCDITYNYWTNTNN